MTNKYKICIILIVYCTFVCSYSMHNDNCDLDDALVKEIASYKNITDKIIKDIKNELGSRMYNLFSEFIDKYGARPSGSKILEDSIDHMVNLTIGSGLNDVTTEEVEVPHWVRGTETLEMLQPRYKKVAIIGLGPSISTPSEGITAELLVVKTFKELDSLNKEDVRGKIILFDEHYTSYGETVIYRVQAASKAAHKGAVASLIRSVTPYSLYTTHTGSQHYDDDVPRIPTAAITVEDSHLLRRLFIRKNKIVLKLKMESTYDTQKSRNTIIDLKGAVDPDKYVIVSGHIDSWDVGQGAMDDGGGMMISWFAPVILNHFQLHPKRTVRAILWTAEEPGLVGAAQYLKRHIKELDKIIFIMESDEGTFEPLGLEVGGSKDAVCIIAEILKLFTPIDNLKVSKNPGSDIILFINEGIPGASLMNKNDKYFRYHHSEADTMDVENIDDVVNCAAFWAAVSYVIADISVDIPRQ
ncbi:carboxypeptidase Q-like isoform X1 [Pieris brassicae]|uniref:carboxypeptidase Q-like isoform X1 n=2 Tax=Pieris brassicae TaxID=7116 RepID=UPI001E65F66A|nr:carboxypeptidase Q-like isoform X1 [Pieris brassicae]